VTPSLGKKPAQLDSITDPTFLCVRIRPKMKGNSVITLAAFGSVETVLLVGIFMRQAPLRLRAA
jgi:hypothetical protein